MIGCDMQRDGIVIRSSIFAGFGAFIRARGATGDVGLPAAIDPEAELPLAVVEQIFVNAARETRDPCLALHWAEAYPIGGSGVFGYLLKNTQNLGDALVVVERYLALIARPVHIALTKGPDVSLLSWHVPHEEARAAPHVLTFSVAATVLRLRAITGKDWNPRGVQLMIRPLACTDTVARILGPNVTYDCQTNVVIVDSAYLTCGADKADPRLFQIIQELGDRILAERAVKVDAIVETQKAIVGRLESGDLTLDLIAGDLDISPRTLQTRLSQAGTSFEALLNETRSTFARHYLVDTAMPLTEIALLLGFSELSAFTRAAQRWFGMPPSSYRRQFQR